jgi:hypothetical protein
MILIPALSITLLAQQKAMKLAEDAAAKMDNMTTTATSSGSMMRRQVTLEGCMGLVDTCWSLALSRPGSDMCEEMREHGRTCLYDLFR